VLAVGVAFVLAGATTAADPLPRVLLAATGVGWLVVSLEPTAQRLHQGLLLVALLTLASGRLRGAIDVALAVAAGAVTLLLVPQVVVVVLFAVVAACAARRARGDPAEWYAGASAAAVAGVLGSAWLLARRAPESFRPEVALVVYEVLLLGVALGVPAAAAASRLYRRRLADRVLAGGTAAGLDGLAQVLRSVLHDPGLRIRRAGEVTPTLSRLPRRLEVRDGNMLLAVLEHRTSALDGHRHCRGGGLSGPSGGAQRPPARRASLRARAVDGRPLPHHHEPRPAAGRHRRPPPGRCRAPVAGWQRTTSARWLGRCWTRTPPRSWKS
jgi:hypothetical protein